MVDETLSPNGSGPHAQPQPAQDTSRPADTLQADLTALKERLSGIHDRVFDALQVVKLCRIATANDCPADRDYDTDVAGALRLVSETLEKAADDIDPLGLLRDIRGFDPYGD
jgi:hypothetical protein